MVLDGMGELTKSLELHFPIERRRDLPIAPSESRTPSGNRKRLPLHVVRPHLIHEVAHSRCELAIGIRVVTLSLPERLVAGPEVDLIHRHQNPKWPMSASHRSPDIAQSGLQVVNLGLTLGGTEVFQGHFLLQLRARKIGTDIRIAIRYDMD